MLTHRQRRYFIVGKLEEEGAGFPAVGLDLVAVDVAEFRFELFDVGKQRFRAAAEIGCFFAAVSQTTEQSACGLRQWQAGKVGECGLNRLPSFGGIVG